MGANNRMVDVTTVSDGEAARALADQPIYKVGKYVVYVTDDVQCWAEPAAIYEALQVDAEVGPHRFQRATEFRAGGSLDFDDLDVSLLPRPSAVRGEALDATTCLSEWMDWCDAVVEAAAAEAGAVWPKVAPERRRVKAAWAAREVWAYSDAAALAGVHLTLAKEELDEAFEHVAARLDLAQTRRLKVMLTTWSSGQAVAE